MNYLILYRDIYTFQMAKWHNSKWHCSDDWIFILRICSRESVLMSASHLCQPISILVDIWVSLLKSVSRLKIWLSGNYNLSYHQSRHTFGTLLVSAGIPIESISKMMGHTSIRTTQIYARVTDDKISEDMDRLIVRRSIV